MNNHFTVLTVSQLNLYVRSLLEADGNLSHMFVRAEISNFSNHYRSGHLYMTLKDDNSAIRAVMFKNSAQHLRFLPHDGLRVIVTGRVSLYERDGQYQFYIDDMQPDGIGALYISYEQLKAKLEAEGLFDKSRKKPLPQYPQQIALITSPTGAALQDMLNIFKRRWPVADIILYPVLVQGSEAPAQICDAIVRLNGRRAADIAIVGRGGGSIEDLWAFNDEKVARAIAASEIPIISAVGHETDFTIADFAADLRAPTPSAAAELASPDIIAVRQYISALRAAAQAAVAGQKLPALRGRLQRILSSSAIREPLNTIEMHRMRLDGIFSRMQAAVGESLMRSNLRFRLTAAKLDVLSPLKVLSRGYSITYSSQNTVISGINDVHEGDVLQIRFLDGKAVCKTLSTETESEF